VGGVQASVALPFPEAEAAAPTVMENAGSATLLVPSLTEIEMFE
jgi:hypothetical protein